MKKFSGIWIIAAFAAGALLAAGGKVKAQSADSVFAPAQGTYGPTIRCESNGDCFSDRQAKPDGKEDAGKRIGSPVPVCMWHLVGGGFEMNACPEGFSDAKAK